MRKCSKCHQDKRNADFYQDKTLASGYKSRCKTCIKRGVMAATAKNRSLKRDVVLNIFELTKEQVAKLTPRQKITMKDLLNLKYANYHLDKLSYSKDEKARYEEFMKVRRKLSYYRRNCSYKLMMHRIRLEELTCNSV